MFLYRCGERKNKVFLGICKLKNYTKYMSTHLKLADVYYTTNKYILKYIRHLLTWRAKKNQDFYYNKIVLI